MANPHPFITADNAKALAIKSADTRKANRITKELGLTSMSPLSKRIERALVETIRLLEQTVDPASRQKLASACYSLRQTWHLTTNTPFPGVRRHAVDRPFKALLPALPIDSVALDTAKPIEQTTQAIDTQGQTVGFKPTDPEKPRPAEELEY